MNASSQCCRQADLKLGAVYCFASLDTGRLWGELYTSNSSLCLLSHQQLSGNNYLGLIKQAVLRDDGVLRLQWWHANDHLRGAPLRIVANGSRSSTGADLSSGLWLEGVVNASGGGIWLETLTSKQTLAGYTASIGSDGTFQLKGLTTHADHLSPPVDALMIDRVLGPADAPRSFRLLARNSVSGEGLVEFYVDEVMSLPVTIQKARLTGVFTALGGAVITAANRLSLEPEAMVAPRH